MKWNGFILLISIEKCTMKTTLGLKKRTIVAIDHQTLKIVPLL